MWFSGTVLFYLCWVSQSSFRLDRWWTINCRCQGILSCKTPGILRPVFYHSHPYTHRVNTCLWSYHLKPILLSVRHFPPMGQLTEGARQAAAYLEEYNRDNYKRWPWMSFLIVAVVSGCILFMAASPLSMGHMLSSQKALSAIFCIIAVLLIVPSVIGAAFYGLYLCFKSFNKPFPYQNFKDKMSGLPPEKDPEPTPSECSARTESVMIWSPSEPQSPQSPQFLQLEAPPANMDDTKGRFGYGPSFNQPITTNDPEVHRAIIEHGRRR